MTRRMLTVCVATITGLSLVTSTATQGQPFIDDFEDGNAGDGEPVTWVPVPGFETGLRYVSNGSYILEPQSGNFNVASFSYVADRTFADVSIRSQIRWMGITSSNSGIGLDARLSESPSGINCYVGAIDTGGRLYISEFVNSNEVIQAVINTSLNPTASDVNLQFDVIGNSLSLYAWQDGTQKPDQPQLEFEDTTNSTGYVGLSLRPSTNRIPVAIRHFTAIPEPSSLLLAFFGLAGYFAMRQRALG